MSLVKVSGTWKNTKKPFVKVAGAWKSVVEEWVKVAGQWYGALVSVFDLTPIRGTLSRFGTPSPLAAVYKRYFVRDDGTQLFHVKDGSPGVQYIVRRPIGTAYDMSTLAAIDKTLDVSSETALAECVLLKPDGSRMYVGTSDSSAMVLEYTLGIAWDVSTATPTGATLSVSDAVTGLYVTPTGSGLMVARINGADITIEEHNLGTSWDLSTVSGVTQTITVPDGRDLGFGVAADGSRLYTQDADYALYQISLPTPYSLAGASTAQTGGGKVTRFSPTYTTYPYNFALSGSGQYVHFVNSSTNILFTVETSDANNLSTDATPVVKQSSVPGESVFGASTNSAETSVIYMDRSAKTLKQRNLSTAEDISTAGSVVASFDLTSQDSQPYVMAISSDGLHLYMAGLSGDLFYEYALATAWDLSTISYTGRSFDFSAVFSVPNDMCLSEDGTHIYVSQNTSVHQFTMSTAYNLGTMSFEKSATIDSGRPSSGHSYRGITVDATTSTMHAVYSPGDVEQFDMATADDVATLSFSGVYFPLWQTNYTANSIRFNARGSRMYIGAYETIYSIQLQ